MCQKSTKIQVCPSIIKEKSSVMYQQKGTEENMGLVNKFRSHKFRHVTHPALC